MKRLSSCFIAACLFVAVIPGLAGALELGARGYYWFPSLSGDLRVDSGSIVGTTFNLKDDLGMGNKNIPSVEAFAGLGKHHFSVMYTQVDFSGSNTLSAAVFDGRTYSGLVESDLKLRMLDAEYLYDLVNFENVLAGFSIGVLGKVRYIDGEARLNNAAVGETKDTFQIPVPMVGVGAHVGILANILEARAKISGMGYSGSYLYEALGEINYTPFPFLDLGGGYRYMKLKIDDISGVRANTELSGPYVSLAIKF